MALAHDLPAAWNAPSTDTRTKPAQGVVLGRQWILALCQTAGTRQVQLAEHESRVGSSSLESGGTLAFAGRH
jgi:hypothetical protein